MLPNLIVVGAMKSGTSSLYHYLAANPALAPARLKEVDFFRTDADFARGPDWYANLFDPTCPFAYDVSPNYTKRHLFPGVARRIAAMLPDARIVYVIRDPIERTISHFVHSSATGSERRSFSEAIRSPESNYVRTSQYYFQISDYLEYFDRHQILLLPSQRLDEDPISAVQEVCAFAGYPTEFDHSVVEQRFHESADKRRASLLERTGRRLIQSRTARSRLRTIAAPVAHRMRRGTPPIAKPTLADADRSLLSDRLGEDAAQLRRTFGVALTGWSV